jgi:predicted glycoside hydrolase/deacetylase ChbG (UPF0249 family)
MHNGYSNYETWRVQLEIFDAIEFDYIVTPEILKEITEDIVFSNVEDRRKLCTDFANAFLEKVNYDELANLINDEVLGEIAEQIETEILDHAPERVTEFLIDPGFIDDTIIFTPLNLQMK